MPFLFPHDRRVAGSVGMPQLLPVELAQSLRLAVMNHPECGNPEHEDVPVVVGAKDKVGILPGRQILVEASDLIIHRAVHDQVSRRQ